MAEKRICRRLESAIRDEDEAYDMYDRLSEEVHRINPRIANQIEAIARAEAGHSMKLKAMHTKLGC